jgi:hypothetical protein
MPQFSCLFYMFRTNLVVHHQEHSTIYCTDYTNLCNTVYYVVLLMLKDYILSKHVEQTK